MCLVFVLIFSCCSWLLFMVGWCVMVLGFVLIFIDLFLCGCVCCLVVMRNCFNVVLVWLVVYVLICGVLCC